jgi:tetratricopeptide (TPR) repeat protein
MTALVALLAALAGAEPELDALTAGKFAFANGDHDGALREFKKAAQQRPSDAETQLWLARALGRKAERSNPFRAAFLVGDVKRAFERAVELDPRSQDARSDLLEFYLEAPGAFGGGIGKARAQAEALKRLNPASGHWAWARIAEKQKNLALAEVEFKAAQAADPKDPGRWREIGHFYRRHGRYADAEAAFRKADDRKAQYYLAENLFSRGAHLEEAVQRVQKFLDAAAPPAGDEPTLAQAFLLKGRLLAKLGRSGEARHSLRAALDANPNLQDARIEMDKLR